MADMSSDATAGRCRVNAELSASVTDAGQLLSYYEKWSNMYDEASETPIFFVLNLTTCKLVNILRYKYPGEDKMILVNVP